MARQWAGRIALGIMGVGLCMGAGKAHARAAITDFEASKLTFDALTATPVYHRPVVHFARHSASHSMAWSGHRAVIRNVAYRPHASVATAAHRHTRSRRT
ncbi:hypothetical protein [Gluconobacter japonicus]|uniref:hypothetical protein n=1 Tax=Gluconobacter japonicus TaxID=376620 RepID=UPI000475054D|nr:hypothetical protein [Gluconobacter japonicus]KXV22630.1 hypothetical protein AD935_03200 [Gluconobacter japonicus]MBS1051269.1 hypothetical protein [Gluconobacter japonicus]GAP24365.1 hypothetical protein GLF_1247 [Gluconobacter frateurii NBRC 101659]